MTLFASVLVTLHPRMHAILWQSAFGFHKDQETVSIDEFKNSFTKLSRSMKLGPKFQAVQQEIIKMSSKDKKAVSMKGFTGAMAKIRIAYGMIKIRYRKCRGSNQHSKSVIRIKNGNWLAISITIGIIGIIAIAVVSALALHFHYFYSYGFMKL